VSSHLHFDDLIRVMMNLMKRVEVKQKSPYFLVVVVIFVLDQITKSWAVSGLNYSEPNDFLPFFNFTLLYNYGAAFSFLSDAGGWQRWFFASLAFAISILLVVWIIRLERTKKLELSALTFVLGGALGNLYDRVLLGYVVDFIDWFYPATQSCLPFFYARLELQTCHWPAFNIADACILIGVTALLVDTFLSKDPSNQEQ
jgi:signal peptidase II